MFEIQAKKGWINWSMGLKTAKDYHIYNKSHVFEIRDEPSNVSCLKKHYSVTNTAASDRLQGSRKEPAFILRQTLAGRACYRKTELEVITAGSSLKCLYTYVYWRLLGAGDAKDKRKEGRIPESYRGDESEELQLMTEERTSETDPCESVRSLLVLIRLSYWARSCQEPPGSMFPTSSNAPLGESSSRYTAQWARSPTYYWEIVRRILYMNAKCLSSWLHLPLTCSSVDVCSHRANCAL